METTFQFNPVAALLSAVETDGDSLLTKESRRKATVNDSADRLRCVHFFRELTDLVIIDNIYRGLS